MSKKSDADNHANQMNPNNDAYWSSRGESPRSEEDSEPEPATPPPAASPSASGGEKK